MKLSLRAPKKDDFIRGPYFHSILKICVYLLICFGITYTLEFTLIPMGGVKSPIYSNMSGFCMFFPMISVYLTYLFTHTPLTVDLKVWSTHLKEHWIYIIVGYFIMPVFSLLGVFTFYATHPDAMDISMGYMINKQQILNKFYDIHTTETGLHVEFSYQMIVALLISPIINLGVTIGEEIGWRLFLFPEMSKILNPKISTWICGVIWGLWHAPLVYFGHNYGTDYAAWPYAGILMTCVMTTFTGNMLNFFYLKTGNVLIPAMMHSSLNALATLYIYFIDTMWSGWETLSVFEQPTTVGVFNLIPFMIAGCVVVVFMSFSDVDKFREDSSSKQEKENVINNDPLI
ncbi:hypothetical protein EIN_083250 [Entamoeba invadens IP1]|uniref:hypothetical protein n=1 Tax=Entamoeba invadens IP1 TaxID=370355 RepID=UPI0002C3D6DE|nr:hypothetical protein EIN_083250 [Entamoeba invadens IP1]ELP85203.1 hypothetical protein EIN_083250 [Entamoeba invadens IP1]|eukprot:XP_004184549.1 hypothetical protein EIN_083250 [Entamoeba invadens IP1]